MSPFQGIDRLVPVGALKDFLPGDLIVPDTGVRHDDFLALILTVAAGPDWGYVQGYGSYSMTPVTLLMRGELVFTTLGSLCRWSVRA